MSNKKSRKFINIMLSAMMILCIGSNTSYADGTSEYGKNGISYVLLNSEFSHPGVYRFNDGAGNVATPWKVFSILDMTSSKRKTSGLAVNQNNKVFLLSSTTGGDFSEAPVGWLPKGIKFPDNSPIYVTAILPSEGATDYKRSGRPHGSTYWKSNETLDNKTYKYAVKFGGPDGVKFLNGVDGEEGTPMWDGTYSDESNTNASAIKHPTDWDGPKGHKIILRSHFGAVGYYLYGTSNLAGCEGLPMDGTDNRDEYIYSDANKYGNYNRGGIDDSRHNKKDEMFECVIKRIYQRRINSLDLYDKIDSSNGDSSYPVESMTKREEDVLKTTDVQVKEYYGKYCGDNCIPGGEMPGGEIGSVLSTVTVVTATTGNRYGFNPMGEPNGTGSEASLRVVKNGITSPIKLADSSGQLNTSNITNYAYLSGKKPDAIKTIGVSSRSDSDNGWDYIYGSCADYFVVQDSWWGKGGIAYEYYKGDSENSGKIVKIDYTNNPGRTASETLGDLEGNVDAIAIDGDGYLYALKTEESPSDEKMKSISAIPNDSKVTVDGQELEITYSGWRRDNSTTVDDETINEGFDEIPDGSQEEGDYRLAKVKQKVYKNIERYPQGTSSLGIPENRGGLEVGLDTWYNKLKKTSYGYNWEYGDTWREEQGTKTSSILAELAVVNVADSPKTFPGTDVLQTIVACDSNFKEQITEDESLTFKIEGFRPYIDGAEKNLIDMGKIKIKNEEHHLLLNTIPAKDGTYEHDENGDNKKSGFPSNMFETDEKRTKVTWTIEYVENTSIEDYINNPKIIESQTNITSNDGKNQQKLTHKFSNPGRYIVKASVEYNLFTNFGTAKNPNDLDMGTKTVEAKPTMISVSAKSLNKNNSPSYITNISMNSEPASKDYGVTGGTSGSTFDCEEGYYYIDNNGKKELNGRKFGDIKISFDAQFFKKVDNKNEESGLSTFDGLGVWDYDTYANMYQKIPNTVPINTTGKHVYNHIGSNLNINVTDINDLTNWYNANVYNPGEAKESDPDKADNGTRVDKIADKDFEFIQWALYLRKFDAPDGKINDIKKDIPRGELIANGNCAKKGDGKSDVEVKHTDNNNRNYTIDIILRNIDSKIDTPRDPCNYVFDLEIIYPRVAWLNNSLGAVNTGEKKYFSSLVPYNPENNMSPIHVLSFLKIDSAPVFVNQSDNAQYNIDKGLCTVPTQAILFNQEPSSFTLCVRDRETPEFNPVNNSIYKIETTGDHQRDKVTFEYNISDNNPFLATKEVDYNNAKKLEKEDALSVSEFLMQTVNEEKFDNSNSNKIYIKQPSDIASYEVDITQTSNNTDFYSDDKWKINVNYKVIVKDISPEIFRNSNSLDKKPEGNNSIIDNYNTLEMENWVGSLSYIIKGHYYDGLGTDSRKLIHYLYDNNAKEKPEEYKGYNVEFSENAAIIPVSSNLYLERYDNDPPSIMVELVSQSDNRRWVYQLIEGVNDNVSTTNKVGELAESKLIINSYNLNKKPTLLTTKENLKIDGTTSYPEEIGVATVTTNLAITEEQDKVIPSFRRASRLLVNVYILDNCGYKELSNAYISISNEGNNILQETIKSGASHNANTRQILPEYENKPRGVYSVNLPMQVAENQPQIKVTVFAQDKQGNKRALVIPVKLVESSFETRVLETKEERK